MVNNSTALLLVSIVIENKKYTQNFGVNLPTIWKTDKNNEISLMEN